MIGETGLSKELMLRLISPHYISLPCDRSVIGLLIQHQMSKVIIYKIEKCDFGY